MITFLIRTVGWNRQDERALDVGLVERLQASKPSEGHDHLNFWSRESKWYDNRLELTAGKSCRRWTAGPVLVFSIFSYSVSPYISHTKSRPSSNSVFFFGTIMSPLMMSRSLAVSSKVRANSFCMARIMLLCKVFSIGGGKYPLDRVCHPQSCFFHALGDEKWRRCF